MGLLRTLLALSVAIAHIHLDTHARVGGGGGAILAVRMFFVLSGFYMALVITDKYVGRPLDFYRARALRLFPLYWITLIVTIVFLFVTGFATATWMLPLAHRIGIDGLLVSAVGNVTFFGLDFGHILCAEKLAGCIPLASLALIPQAWTLAIEAAFYAIVPLIALGGHKAALLLAVISILVNGWMSVSGLTGPGWSRQFFPAETIYFMLGMLAFYAYDAANRKLNPVLVRLSVPTICVTFVVYVVIVQVVGNRLATAETLIVIACAICAPFAFEATKRSQLDATVGDLSYPLYITHYLVLKALMYALNGWEPASMWPRFLVILASMLAMAWASVLLIEQPVERWRHKPRYSVRAA